jgi:hypothetical protein
MLALIEETRTDEALRPMTDNIRPNPQPRWLHVKGACRYIDLSFNTLMAKLRAGTGPQFYRSPGSKNLIFWTPDLDLWITTAPERQLTQAERGRLAKLQLGAQRVLQERRARRQAKIEKDAMT